MSLKRCRECDKQVSDQAEVCPNCGIKKPIVSPTAGMAGPAGQLDEAILNLGSVVVTRTLAKFQSQTFPINGIGSVTLKPPKRGGTLVFGGIFLALGAFELLGGDFGGGAVLLLVSGVAFVIANGKQHALFIKTASGDVRAMVGDQKTLDNVKEAIERAATMRG